MLATLLAPPTSRLLPEARHVVLPSGIVSSGAPAVRATCATIGLHHDSWQRDSVQVIEAKDCIGEYAADTVVLSIPRQVGKTWLVGSVIFADCIINPGTTVVWTAHRFKVARETFTELKALATAPHMAAHIDPDAITTAAGNECIPFLNGSRIVFAARERGALRGFTRVRRLVLDEGQILTEAAMSDLAPTQNQAVNPQIILMGTPPKPSDPGEVFTNLRTEALSGTSDGVVYIEFSADPACDINDTAAWHQANPSLGSRTPIKAIHRLRKLLSNDDDFRREALGIWPEGASSRWQVFTEAQWLATSRPAEVGWLASPVRLAIEVAPDLGAASIAVAAECDGGHGFELIDHREGTWWLVDRLAELAASHGITSVVLDEGSPADQLPNLTADLEAIGLEVVKLKTDDVAKAAAAMYLGITGGTVAHVASPDQAPLDESAADAVQKVYGDVWLWNRRTNGSPLIAASLALHAAMQADDGAYAAVTFT